MNKNMANRQIAELFRQIAAVYAVTTKDHFHIRAYENAAQSIETFTTPLREIWQEGKLDEVPGIGTSFTKYLEELFQTGKIKHFERLTKKAPEGMFPLLSIPGVGPQTALKLSKGLHLTKSETALNKVGTAIRSGRVGKLLSAKIAAKILGALSRSPQNRDRMLLGEAEKIAEDVIAYLKISPDVQTAKALGSLRRRLPTVGDVDIAVSTKNPAAVVVHLKKFPHLRRSISMGEKMIIFEHTSGKQVDIKTSSPEGWGDMLVHYTGGKLHNIRLRTLALDQGKSVSEFGIEHGGKKILHSTEEELYRDLGLAWIPPELREDGGEIEAAKLRRLPKLIELKDIRGDFHLHSNLEFPSSHDSGDDGLEQMLEKALDLNYAYIGLSDHSPKHSNFTAHQRLAAVKKRNAAVEKAIETVRSKRGKVPEVFVGLEVDILENGSLALEDEAINLLDYVIVSIHAQFNLSENEQTKRILAALAHPKVAILGHPTARHLLKREEIQCDWREIFTYCAQYHKLLEINAAIDRLDLPFPLVHLAGQMGCQFIIDTDSHRTSDMMIMKYGVDTARKGWATSEMIANTRDVFGFSTIISSATGS